MNKLFSPLVRDRAIDTTCSNLIMAGILPPEELSGYMANLTRLNDYELAEQLCASRILLDKYLETARVT